MRHVCAFAILFGIVGLYVGGYYAVVDADLPQYVDSGPTREFVNPINRNLYVRAIPDRRLKYRFEETLGAGAMRTFFTPIHWLDKQIRSDLWNGVMEE